jgi:hypothetical protein
MFYWRNSTLCDDKSLGCYICGKLSFWKLLRCWSFKLIVRITLFILNGLWVTYWKVFWAYSTLCGICKAFWSTFMNIWLFPSWKISCSRRSLRFMARSWLHRPILENSLLLVIRSSSRCFLYIIRSSIESIRCSSGWERSRLETVMNS